MSQRGQAEEVVAWVNGEPVTKGDVVYQLQVAHRREDLSGAGAIDVSEYVQKVIDNTLLVQEARIMGLNNTPSFRKAVDDYILRESVVRLHQDEVLDKAGLEEGDIEAFYKKNFEFFTLNHIVTDSEERAQEALEKLKEGEDFEEVASVYSKRGNESEDEEQADTEEESQESHQIVVSLDSLTKTPKIEEAVLALEPGDMTDVIESNEQYFIIMLVGRESPDPEELEKEHVRGKMEKKALKAKQLRRGDEYIAELREKAVAEGQLRIDEEVLSSIDLGDHPEEIKDEFKDDARVVAEVYGDKLTVANVAATAKFGKSKKEIVDSWVSFELVDHEALSRHYEETPEFKDMLNTYKKQLLKDAFVNKVIMSQIMISDGLLKDYYAEKKEKFAEAPRYKVQQITLKTMEDAQSVLGELKGGADFSWVAKNRSTDANRNLGGNLGWKQKERLPLEYRDYLDSLEPGEISPIIETGSSFVIIRMQGKREGKAPGFEVVKADVFSMYMKDKSSSLMDEYVSELREGADIRINEKVVRSLENQFGGGE
ncbi:MAG: peptidyl-prolyl cis-trans isomerase [Nitrospirota bacterium]|jgi:parvulin-like peptidyl-prolyl isomerase